MWLLLYRLYNNKSIFLRSTSEYYASLEYFTKLDFFLGFFLKNMRIY
jgi:hypothetical protein